MADTSEIVEWPSDDDECTGQPSTSGTAMSRAWVQDLILGHWQVTIRDLLGVTNLATGTVHSSVHAVSLQHLTVTLFNCSRIQPYIRQTKMAIFQLQTDTQNLMTGLDLAFTGKKHLDLLTAKTLFELPPWHFTSGWKWKLLHQPYMERMTPTFMTMNMSWLLFQFVTLN